MNDLQELMDDLRAWSDATFGMYRTSRPIVAHLKEELDELDEVLDKYYQGCYTEKIFIDRTQEAREEFADCFMLLLDAASHFNLNSEMILSDIKAKLEINKKRKWGNPDKNGAVKHIPE